MGYETQSIRRRIIKRRLTLTTNATGTMATTTLIEGEIVKLHYDRNSSLLTTVDIDVTDNDTGEVIWSEDDVTDNTKTVYPAVELSGTSGAFVANQFGKASASTVKVTLAQGGATKTGYVTIFYR